MVYFHKIMYYFTYLYIKIISYFNYLIGLNEKNKDINNVIISLTTIPSRSPYILDTLNSILNQTQLPRMIYIGIPYASLREPGLDYRFPKKIYNHKLIKIVYYENDEGPIMKLLTGLRQLQLLKKDYKIITIDDDMIYDKHLIKNLLREYNKNENNVYCSIGRNAFGEKLFNTSNLLRTVEGYGGVIYNSSFFNLAELLLHDEIPYYIKTNDDLFISAYLRRKNIKIYGIKNNIDQPLSRYLNTRKSNPLWIINEKTNFLKAATYLNIFIPKQI